MKLRPVLRNERLPNDQRLLIWKREKVSDYTVVAPLLPVIDMAVTQLAPGQSTSDISIIKADDLTVFHARHQAPSVDSMVLDPGYAALILVEPTSGECRVNGSVITTPTIHMPGADNTFYIRGEGRDVTTIILPRQKFIETIGVLGMDNNKGTIPESCSTALSPEIGAQFRQRITQLFDQDFWLHLPSSLQGLSVSLGIKLFSLACDAYLVAINDSVTRQTRNSSQWIVRTAEERFLAARGHHISLSDLCLATGVSKSTLYNTFHAVCGNAPLEYFHKRQLMMARSILLNSARKRGAVKQSALTVGMTQLGRFSVEYRQLFGESPSDTLSNVSREASNNRARPVRSGASRKAAAARRTKHIQYPLEQ